MSLDLIDSARAFTTALVLLAGAFAFGLVFHGFAARHRERRDEHALLAILCFSACTYLVLESCLYQSREPAVHGLLRKWEQYAGAPFLVAYPLYLAGLVGISRRAVAFIVVTIAAITIAATIASTSGLWLVRIDRLQEFRLPWGEVLMLARGPASLWMYHSLASWLGMCCFGLWCAMRLRRDPAAIGVAPMIIANGFFFVALVHDSLLDMGLIRSVFISEFASPILAASVWWRITIAERRRLDAWRLLFDRAGDAIVVHDLVSGRIVEANEAASALLGRPRKELVGYGLEVVLAGGPHERDHLLALASTQGSALVERDCRDEAGRDFAAEIAVRVATLEDRPSVVASIRDLSLRRVAERSLVANEVRLRQLIERCPIPITESVSDGSERSCNPSFVALFGDGPGPLALRAPTPPSAARGDGAVISFRATVGDRSGRLRQVDVSSVGAGERLVTFVTDLSDILDARDRLVEREALHRAVIEEASDGVFLASMRTAGERPTIAIWNRRMEEISQRSAAEADADGQWAEALAHRPMQDRDIVWRRPDGTLRSCLLTWTEVPGPASERRVLSIVRDVTEQRQAEDQRQQLEAQAQWIRQYESLGVLAGGIAHDYNNLLMAILGRTGLIRATLDAHDDRSRSDLLEIESAAQRAAELCGQMLSYAGKGAGRIGAVDLHALIGGMDRMLAISVSKRIALVREPPTCPALVEGDANQLRQVIVNLVTNASESFGDRSGTIRIRISPVTLVDPETLDAGTSVAPGRYVAVEVIDDAQGMDADTAQRVFEPFFTTKFTGRGLGLSVVLGIVRAHSGGISVRSSPGAGTAVRVMLPLRTAAPAPERPLTAATSRATALIVDDDPSIRLITVDMLVHLGYAVREAISGREAMASFARGEIPDVVVLDVSLPDLSGEDVMRALRPLAPATRIVMVSGYGRDDIEHLVGSDRADAILTKPYDLEALAAALGSAPRGVS